MNGTENNQSEIMLSATEKDVLETFAQGEPPFSQRARALLAVADGADLASAGTDVDLTENQVRYWLGRFRSKRLDIFPEIQLPTPEEGAESVEAHPTLLSAPPESPKLQAPPKVEELTAGTSDPGNVIELPATLAAAAVVKAGKSKQKKKKERTGKKSKKVGKGKSGNKDKKKKKGKNNSNKKKKNKKSKKNKKNGKNKKSTKKSKKK